MNLLKGFLMVVDSQALGAALAVLLLFGLGLISYRATRCLFDKLRTRDSRQRPTMRPRVTPLSDGHSIARRFSPDVDAMGEQE